MTMMSSGLVEQRFWMKVQKTSFCWLWKKPHSLGYGHFRLKGKTLKAHRVSWTIHNGPIPKGMQVNHACDVKHCVNPDHLFLGSQWDNVQDCIKKGRNSRGLIHGRAKFSGGDIRRLRKRAFNGESRTQIAKDNAISRGHLCNILTGRYWKHVED